MEEKEGGRGLAGLPTQTRTSPLPERSPVPGAELAPATASVYLHGPVGGTCHGDHFAGGKDEAGEDRTGGKRQRWVLNSDREASKNPDL